MAIESDPTTSSASSAAHEREHDAAQKMAESDYLAQQAQAAREALSRTAQELLNKVSHGVDPRELAKDHPWLTLAAAAAGGFAAAAIAVPSKEQQALKRLAEMERAVGIARNGNGHDRHDNSEDAGVRQYARGQSSFWGGMGKQVLEAVKPALLSALTAGITAKAAKTEPEDIAAAHASPPPQV